MARITDGLHTLSAGHRFDTSLDSAWASITCPRCPSEQAVVVARQPDRGRLWAKCVGCGAALASNGGVVSPPVRPLRSIKGLPAETEVAWREVRDCLSVGASTAAAHMARKIIFHVAVAEGLPAKDDRDRAPTFAACVDFLEREGVITRQMRPWLDRVREVGNSGAHEIDAVERDQALDVARFVEQVLVIVYEIPALMEAADPSEDSGDVLTI